MLLIALFRSWFVKAWPKPGEIWLHKDMVKGPWKRDNNYGAVSIRDVSQHIVRYSMGEIFNDERMDLSTFLYIYKRETGA